MYRLAEGRHKIEATRLIYGRFQAPNSRYAMATVGRLALVAPAAAVAPQAAGYAWPEDA